MTEAAAGVAAVILDLDGLALDTEPAYRHAWRRAAQDLGYELGEDVCATLSGHHADHVRRELQRLVGDRFDPARFYPLAESYWYQHLGRHGVPTMAGLEQLLALLETLGIPYAVATNSDRRYAVECLRRAGMEEALLAVTVCRSDVVHGKPEPDLILEAARRLRVAPGRCLVLEDSEAGLTAAVRAGALPVLVQSRTHGERLKSLARWAFADLREVAQWLARSCGRQHETALPA